MNAQKSAVIYAIVSVTLILFSGAITKMFVAIIRELNSDLAHSFMYYYALSFALVIVQYIVLYSLLKRSYIKWPILRFWIIGVIVIHLVGIVMVISMNGEFNNYVSIFTLATVLFLYSLAFHIIMAFRFQGYPQIQLVVFLLIGYSLLTFVFNRVMFHGVSSMIGIMFSITYISLTSWFIYRVLDVFDHQVEQSSSEFELDQDQYTFDDDFSY